MKILAKKYFIGAGLAVVIGFLFWLYILQKKMVEEYRNQQSLVVLDRNSEVLCLEPNEKGNYSQHVENVPEKFKELILEKEDKYFYWHFGINPVSAIRGAFAYFKKETRGSSTITQQLVKILLSQETERSIKNKVKETFYVFGLELFHSKKEILTMYANSAFFGNHAQGIKEASLVYFHLPPELLPESQIIQIIASLSSPAGNNPSQEKNAEISLSLARNLGLDEKNLAFISATEVKENMKKINRKTSVCFELEDFITQSSAKEIETTVDYEINEKIRKIVQKNIKALKEKQANNAAVLVASFPENEILALIGSPFPESAERGYQINMLKKPRPIGSTFKPFIYAKAFEKGLRPYTLVDDREYKYIMASGFPLYPQNFDFKYRGEVSLHYALSNSLNVPAVKVLEYVGLQDFYSFLKQDLGFSPVQEIENYQLGISLGSLEMSLVELSRYFTIFGNNGILKELKIEKKEIEKQTKKIFDQEYVELINKILSDRKTGAEQFGLISDLNLFQQNYALKTGTSADYKDSWIIGYTPDFLVAVWLGNSDNSPMDEVSGQKGAGRIWAEIMDLMLNSKYNRKTNFSFNLLKEFPYQEKIEFGLPGDDFEKCLYALKEKDFSLILSPHQNDYFLLEQNTEIILEAKEEVDWFINENYIGAWQKDIFIPKEEGVYNIEAVSKQGTAEKISIIITKE